MGDHAELPERSEDLKGGASRDDVRSNMERLSDISNSNLQSPDVKDEEASRISLGR